MAAVLAPWLAFAAETTEWWIPGVASFLVSLLLFGASKLVSPLVCPAYKKLKPKHRIDWDSRIASSVHAVLSTVLSILALSSGRMLDAGHSAVPAVARTSPMSQLTLSISLGYLLADFVLVTCYWFALGDPAMLAHHVVGITSLSVALASQKAHPYAMLLLITEITTPFLNIRWYLNHLDLNGSLLFIANALVILFLWLTVRVVMFLWYFHHLWQQWPVAIYQLSWPQQFLVGSVPVVLFVLNIFWLHKIVNAALRFFAKPSSKRE